MFLHLPEFPIYNILFLLSIGRALPFFLSMAFGGGHLTVSLMACSLEEFSHPKGTGYYNNWHRGASVSNIVLLTFTASGIDGQLRGAREYQVRSLGTKWQLFFFFFFYFGFMHFKSLLTVVWERLLAEKIHRRKSKIVERTKRVPGGDKVSPRK